MLQHLSYCDIPQIRTWGETESKPPEPYHKATRALWFLCSDFLHDAAAFQMSQQVCNEKKVW